MPDGGHSVSGGKSDLSPSGSSRPLPLAFRGSGRRGRRRAIEGSSSDLALGRLPMMAPLSLALRGCSFSCNSSSAKPHKIRRAGERIPVSHVLRRSGSGRDSRSSSGHSRRPWSTKCKSRSHTAMSTCAGKAGKMVRQPPHRGSLIRRAIEAAHQVLVWSSPDVAEVALLVGAPPKKTPR